MTENASHAGGEPMPAIEVRDDVQEVAASVEALNQALQRVDDRLRAVEAKLRLLRLPTDRRASQ